MESRTGCDTLLSSPGKVGYLRTFTPGGLGPYSPAGLTLRQPLNSVLLTSAARLAVTILTSLLRRFNLCWITRIQLVIFGFLLLFG